MTNIKQVIILRKDLNMRKGKMVAQGAHASMGAILNVGTYNRGENPSFTLEMNEDMKAWLTGSFTKICVSCNDEQELIHLYKQALDADIPCALIEDSGRTEFNNVPTHTAVAIGPAESEEIDKITGLLKLL